MSVHVPWSADGVAGGQPTCVTQRELSGPDSGHQKHQDGIRGAGHTPGRMRNMLNEPSEDSGPGPMLCQMPWQTPSFNSPLR